ncbi:hypothetical protein ACSBR2_042670 [Camellia fascicularis]
MRSLKFFDISLNQFIGNISPSLFGSLNSLEYIGLGYNRFEGLFSFSSFANHSNLEVVELISDNDKFEVETELTNWIPMFQLKVLVLSNCNLNKLFGNVPKFLLCQNKLMFVDLSHNNLRRSFPNWPLVNNTRLEILFLRNNAFVNPFSLPQYCYISTNGIDISDNRLSGQIQANIGDMNAFEGGIPSSFGKMSKLSVLDLSTNNFSGEVSKGIIESKVVPFDEVMYDEVDKVEFVTKSRSNSYKGNILNFMSGLDLSHNKLLGNIPFELGNLSNVHALNLSRNLLTRLIPKTFSNLTQVESLDLSYNSLSGNIPTELINLNFLKAQFGTFEASSYEGNPFLCGQPLEKICTAIVDSPHSPTTVSLDETGEKWYDHY